LSSGVYALDIDNLAHGSNMANAGAFRISTNGNSAAFVVNGAGNVGIGTTPSIDYRLDVNGSLRANTRVNFASLPTSTTGLVSGDLWRNGTIINIVA
jgi:hypothetical protein